MGTADLVWLQVILGSFGPLVSKWPISLKRLVTYVGYIWPCMVQGHFEIIWCTFLIIACISKKVSHRHDRVENSEIWDSWRPVIHMGYICFVRLRSFWGHSVHLSQNCLYITRTKWNEIWAKWSEIWDSILVIHMYLYIGYIWPCRVQGIYLFVHEVQHDSKGAENK